MIQNESGAWFTIGMLGLFCGLLYAAYRTMEDKAKQKAKEKYFKSLPPDVEDPYDIFNA